MINGEACKIVKRSLTLRGHRTSVSLEAPFWRGLARMAAARNLSVNALAAELDAARAEMDPMPNLSSLIRVAVLAAQEQDR